MKILILGGTGMLGYGVTKAFLDPDIENYRLYVTSRLDSSSILENNAEHFRQVGVIPFDAFATIESGLDRLASLEPNYIINCIGVIKPFIHDNEASSIYVNSVFPHLLSAWAAQHKIKVIHITTDCVFSGSRGRYTEEDPHDERDIYGQSKSLGEPNNNCMVLRTSIIGPEIHKFASLLSWAQSQKGQEVKGYTNHKWNGVTTKEYGRICKEIIDKNLYVHGKFHMFSPNHMSKFQILKMLSNEFDLGLKVLPHKAETSCDRTLKSVHSLCNNLKIKPFQQQLRDLK